jgi:hypothetical protein
MNVGPPDIFSLTPNTGIINVQQSITITGDNFYGNVNVRFDGKSAGDVQVIDSQTIQCTCPIGNVLGTVDVEVSNAFGSDQLLGAYTYTSLWTILDNAVIGQQVHFAAAGPPGGKWGAVVDTVPGPTLEKGVVWCLGFSPARVTIHNAWAGDAFLNGIGQGVTFHDVPNDPGLIGQTLYTRAVFDGNGPQTGRPLVLSDCKETVVLGE